MEYFLGHFAKQFIVNDFEDSEIFKTLHISRNINILNFSLETDPGSCSLCAGCAESPGPLWSGSCIPPGKLLCCLHFEPTSAGCPHTETGTGCETAAHVGAVYRSLNNRHLEDEGMEEDNFEETCHCRD